jgi:Alpha/beta hydrolase family
MQALLYRITGEEPPPWRPTTRQVLADIRANLGLPWLLRHAGVLRQVPQGDGSIVVLIPGFMTPDAVLWPMQRFLTRLGLDARGWGLGFNTGNPEHNRDRLLQRLTALRARDPRPVHLVGWSLGGAIAREVARVAPGLVASVTTLGAPVMGGPTHTVLAPLYGRAACERLARLVHKLDTEQPLQVPVLVVFSRRDAVVSWPASLDHHSPHALHLEAESTHLGLILDPRVWASVARFLAQVGQGGVRGVEDVRVGGGG